MFKPTERDFEYIKENYQTTISREIAKVLGCSESFVKKHGRRLTGKKNNWTKYQYNKDFFKNIDSEVKTYWLGFIMADGCIYDRKKGNSQKWLAITIQYKDRALLEKFKKAIDSNHPIRLIERKDGSGHKYTTITIVGDELCNDLIRYGVTPNKQGKEIIPNLPKRFIIPYIYGYFDADGSITDSNSDFQNYCISFSGNEKVLNQILNNLQEKDIGEGIGFSKDNRGKNYSYGNISISKQLDMLKIINLFTNKDWFDEEYIGLDRKIKLMNEYKRRLLAKC